ncbi:hypothetical protein BCR41DRAFT_211834 [Lobosporangium transversale]|uniref:Uncharacterized protein n=1 Tax=Lobosporangium transversale TaxID=64571 RepID=A0A1Y2G7H7_9FUNG|nr:hypothetical protein BCR41DRAFT_211834 [Lobosporangium transversale]ORZ00029.1 hypothetical protein BCR41DRAFT_211834 [Lobosporangium transversale]|eukprot:XP_021876070.1 hypothetical protein BCR41DRAFT_211834 [Lobosporangium transversale]
MVCMCPQRYLVLICIQVFFLSFPLCWMLNVRCSTCQGSTSGVKCQCRLER